jgi:hypothetical protein
MGIFYFLSPRVTRSIRYGLAPRNRLDLFRPPTRLRAPPQGYPVVIYITGALSFCFVLFCFPFEETSGDFFFLFFLFDFVHGLGFQSPLLPCPCRDGTVGTLHELHPMRCAPGCLPSQCGMFSPASWHAEGSPLSIQCYAQTTAVM